MPARLRRYDDVIQLLASVLLGIGLQFFEEIASALFRITGGDRIAAYGGTSALFAAFFRNIHGLIAYDVWAESTDYRPPFERKTSHIVEFFGWALVAAVILPSVAVYEFSSHAKAATADTPAGWLVRAEGRKWWMLFFLILPIALYIPWNWRWMRTLRKAGDKTQRSAAHLELKRFTRRWFVIDIVWVVLAAGLAWIWWPLDEAETCRIAVVAIAAAVGLDYVSHGRYYFPVPSDDTASTPPDGVDYQQLWHYVLPDGNRFCHWGGVRQTRAVVQELAVTAGDTILEVGCGSGGAISLISGPRFVCGVDTSLEALRSATGDCDGSKTFFVGADAVRLPFAAAVFSKVLAQDCDAWLSRGKARIMREIARVTRDGGLFVYQTYARAAAMPASAQRRTDELLRRCGYEYTETPVVESLEKMFADAGFRVVSSQNLYKRYSADHLRMLALARRNKDVMYRRFAARHVDALCELPEWERELFIRDWWTGFLIAAIREGR